MQDLNRKSLNEMALHERMEYQKRYDHAVILQASMQGAKAELKRLPRERKHPFDPEFVGRR